MKKFKKLVLSVLCLGVIFGTVACGNRNAEDDAANDTKTEQNDTMNDVTDGRNNNNVTDDGNNNNNNVTDDRNNDGVMDDLGNAVGDGIEDVGDGVKDVTDDLTGNDARNNRTNNR